MALQSVESNSYAPADGDGLFNAGKNDSEAEEDLEDGEIADEEELEEGAIADEDDDKVSEQPKSKEKRNASPKRERSIPHDHDRASPSAMHDHSRKKRKRPEKQPRKKKRPYEPDMQRPHDEMHGKFAHQDRRHSPNFGRDPGEGGYHPEDDSNRTPKRKRMDNNAEHNRNKRNRRQSPGPERREKPTRHIPEHRKRPCHFYLQGKCHKGEHCQYMHTGNPERKFELCKFYLMDCCAKKEKCLYMHSDFPCKYFHTGMKCFAKENCKFSHQPLSDKTREILLKHIETAPKEILGEFPRLPRDEHGEMMLPVVIPPNMEGGGMIPSLLDMRIYSEEGAQGQGEGQEEQGGSSSHERRRMPSDEEEEDYETQLKKRMHAQRQEREHQHEEETPTFNFYRDMNEQSQDKKKRSPKKSVRDDSDDENGLVIEDDREDDSSQRESGTEDVAVPSNLPKRQRELFLRIQHQQLQRDAAANAEDKEEDDKSADDDDSGAKGENWYSSDDEAEDKNLTEVLKNLKDSDDPKTKSKTADAPYDLSGFNLSDDLTKLLSTIKPKEPEVNRDPRGRDPRSRPEPAKADVDLRIPAQKPSPVSMSSGDTDLRQTMFGDTDLRETSMMGSLGLPFKPAPLHMPCVEIDASISSHPEIKFQIKPLVCKNPDYSGLRLNYLDPAIRMDPRLQKLVAEFDSSTVSPMSPPPMSEPNRGDPRQRSGSDPRMQVRQPTLIPTQSQMNPVAANFMMMAGMCPPQDPQGLLGAGPMMGGMMAPMIPPGNYMANMQQQQGGGGYQQQQHHGGRGRGGNGWRPRGRGRRGGFRGGRGWGKFDKDRNDRRDRGSNMSPANRTPEYSNDSDD